MITIKINKHLKIQKYLIRGIKMFVKIKEKWYCLKINDKDMDCLIFVIKSLCE